MQSSLSFKVDDSVADIDGKPEKRSVRWAIIIGFWTFFGLLNASQLYLGVWREGMQLSFWRVFATDVFGWWAWIPATPIVLWLGRRFPIERGTWWRVVPIHFV